jgi:hypothetical protein
MVEEAGIQVLNIQQLLGSDFLFLWHSVTSDDAGMVSLKSI